MQESQQAEDVLVTRRNVTDGDGEQAPEDSVLQGAPRHTNQHRHGLRRARQRVKVPSASRHGTDRPA